jgi:predicted acyltransferase
MPQPRLVSLDAFRGLTMAAMVLVNNPGTWSAVYPPLRHAEWHGLTPTDVIFPFFLFIVGVAIPLARPGPGRILRRAAVIFALGLLLNAVPSFDWATLRIPGVLQRIAVCYLVASLLFLRTDWRTQAAVTGVLLLGYWALIQGDLSPADNLAARIDRAVLGPPHLLRLTRVYDPEGILSTLPAIATVLLGVLTGHWLQSSRPPRAIARGLAVAGALGVVVGAAWGLWLPVNKALWTSSYAVLSAGLALLVFAMCYWAIEVRDARRWAWPFGVLGVNALALFFLSSLTAILFITIRVDGGHVQGWLFRHLFAPWARPVNASLAYAVAYVLLWWLAMWGLYRAGVRLRA